MEFLVECRLLGLIIGIGTFLIIGLFHPVVIKAEYYWGTRCWWIFLLLGLAGVAVSLVTENVLLSALAGVFAFSSFWTIKELSAKGGFPKIPAEKTDPGRISGTEYLCPRGGPSIRKVRPSVRLSGRNRS